MQNSLAYGGGLVTVIYVSKLHILTTGVTSGAGIAYTLSGNLTSSPVFSGVRVTLSLAYVL